MKSIVVGISRFLRVPSPHRRAVLRGLMITPRVSRSLHRSGYATTLSWLGTKSRPHVEESEVILAARRVDTAIRAVPWGVRCLERSLVVWWILGVDAEIRRGVAIGHSGGPHLFHAWVECAGIVVNDSPNIALEYSPLDRDKADSTDPLLFD